MDKELFERYVTQHSALLRDIRESAHRLHDSVNQHYDGVHPYGYHLDMVADAVFEHGHLVCAAEADILPLVFGAYYHDSIEDARLTYHDVRTCAARLMDDGQAYMAAEIVYALTNEKGRTRAERAGERYYQGIRQTPYAPFVKLADRLANITYSCSHSNDANRHMRQVYRGELPHFLAAIAPADTADQRFALPEPMVAAIHALITD